MPVVVLPSARQRDAAANLEAMVARARDEIGAFGADLAFDTPVWSLPSGYRASASQRWVNLYFSTHDGGTSKDMTGRTPLAEPFASFLKAVVRLREEAKPKRAQNHGVMVRAGRYLHDTLAARGHDPAMLLPQDFVDAAQAAKDREAPSSRYRIGLFLEELADWVNRYNVAKVRIDFVNPFPRVAHADTRIGKEADERRERMLPSDAALDALARIANLATEPADVLRMRCVELLLCGGWRINELLTVPADCEVWEPVFLNGEPVVGPDGEQTRRYGIRYFAEKGGDPGIKWIPTAMIDVARRAIADIRRVTEAARGVASWNAANPGRAWLPDGWRGLARDTAVTAADIEAMFGLSDGASFLRKRNAPRLPDGRLVTTIGALEAALLAATPRVKIGEAEVAPSWFLFVAPLNWAHRQRGVIPAVVGLVQDQQISDLMVGRAGVASIFERFGFREPDGSPILIRSHQFRHLLNTLAQQGGMGQMEIARWSGRKDVGQNAAYDHTSGIELAERARDMLAAGKVAGAIAEAHDRLPPVRREEFRKAQFATAHTTDLGMCVNDWSLTPCMEHGSCAACSQHLVVKGNGDHRGRAAELLGEHEFLLAAAETEAADETYGASNYIAHNRRMRDAMKAVLAVHDDPEIADGTLVQVDLNTGDAVPTPPPGEDEADAA